MSAAGAVQMGSAFVKFFGEASELMKSFREAGTELNKFGKFAKQSISEFAGSFNYAEKSAEEFGQTTSTSLKTVAADFSHVSQAAAGTTTAVAGTATSFQRVTGAASAAGAGILKAAANFNIFRVGAGAIAFVAANLGSISKLAGAASWGLYAVSKAMKAMGYDTTKIDQVKTALNRIGWAAFGANVAVTAVTRTLKGMQAVAMAPVAIAKGLARVASGASRRIGRFGGLASLGASVADEGAIEPSVSGGAEEGEKKSGGFMKAIGPVLTGLAIAGPVGAAATALGVFIAGAFSSGAKSGTGFFAQLQERGAAWAAWIGGIWTTISEKFKSVFASMGGTGDSFLTKMEKAFIPLVYAVENVWVPAFVGAIDYIGGMFKGNTDKMSGSWTDWILDSVSALAEFIGNFDLYFQIAQQNIVLWASNAILQVGDFFTNAGEWLDWFGANWFNVLTDAYNFSSTVFRNLGSDLKDLFSRIWEWVKSGFTSDMNFDGLFDGLTDGYMSAIKEWPKLTKTELETMTPELKRLYAELGQRQDDAAANGHLIKAVDKAASAAKPASEKGKEFDTAFSAISAQSQDAYSALARAQNQSMAGNPQLAESKKQTSKLSEAVGFLKDIAKSERGPLVEYQLPA